MLQGGSVAGWYVCVFVSGTFEEYWVIWFLFEKDLSPQTATNGHGPSSKQERRWVSRHFQSSGWKGNNILFAILHCHYAIQFECWGMWLGKKVLDDFLCACQADGELLLSQGKMYVTDNYICFYSLLTGAYKVDFLSTEPTIESILIWPISKENNQNRGHCSFSEEENGVRHSERYWSGD